MANSNEMDRYTWKTNVMQRKCAEKYSSGRMSTSYKSHLRLVIVKSDNVTSLVMISNLGDKFVILELNQQLAIIGIAYLNHLQKALKGS